MASIAQPQLNEQNKHKLQSLSHGEHSSTNIRYIQRHLSIAYFWRVHFYVAYAYTCLHIIYSAATLTSRRLGSGIETRSRWQDLSRGSIGKLSFMSSSKRGRGASKWHFSLEKPRCEATPLLFGGCFGWFVARSWWLVGRSGASKFLWTTWHHPFEPRKEVVGSWWRHLVAWMVGWCLGFRSSGAKALGQHMCF